MFGTNIYIERRKTLKSSLNSGIILIMGNNESPMNYPKNTYHFRQDSTFLYYFWLHQDGLAGLIDVDENREYVFGNDADMDDIIWMGVQPSMTERCALVGVENTRPLAELDHYLETALTKGRKIHFTPPYRHDNMIWMNKTLGIPFSELKQKASVELIKAIAKQRSVKADYEIKEIEKALETAYLMHTTAMKMAKAGVVEREIAGAIEGIALANGGPVSFPVILSINGQTLHNHYHGNTLKEGRMLVVDAGCETEMHYCSDITRTVPVGGRFNHRQRDIYQAVLDTQMAAIKEVKPGIMNKELHLIACKSLTESLKAIGLMKGNTDDAVAAGAHALFLPHGLGHMMGLDVHDMENFGENYVGYDDSVQRSEQFGLAFLRLAKKLEAGYVFTIEPGCYFIPALIDQWKAENKFADYLNYNLIETYKDFGGIRIEDDILVTENGHRVLGKPIPKSIADIEKMMG